MSIVIIDDNLDFLNQLSQKGYKTLCSKNRSLSEIVNDVSKQSVLVNEIFINISLISNDSNKRLDYSGINLMQRLMFEIRAGKWNLLSFEKQDSILKKHNTQILSKLKNVNIVDYITFLKEAAKNVRK